MRTLGLQLTEPAAGLPLRQLLEAVGAFGNDQFPQTPYHLQGDAQTLVRALAPLAHAQAGDLSFCWHASYARDLATSQASAVITHAQLAGAAPAGVCCVVTDKPQLLYARLSQWWQAQSLPFARELQPAIHSTAVVADDAQIDPSAQIGPLCVIESGARVGARTRLYAQVRLAYGCSIGDDCVVQSGVVIGADGFGNVNTEGFSQGQWLAIAQLGAVRIGNRVDIGANTCIDRGALDDTVIEDGVKIDNLVHIAHNVRIGRNSALAGQVGIAGSARIGAQCTLGGDSKMVGHIALGDHVHISGVSVVMKSLPHAGRYTGIYPLDTHERWEKNAATLRQLDKLRARVRALEQAQHTPQQDDSGHHL